MSAPPTAPITTSANSCYSPLRNRSRGLERVGVKFKPRLRSARPPIQLPAQSFNFPGSLAALLSRLSLLDALNHDKCRKIAITPTTLTNPYPKCPNSLRMRTTRPDSPTPSYDRLTLRPTDSVTKSMEDTKVQPLLGAGLVA